MTRVLAMLAVLGVLISPVLAGAESENQGGTPILSEADWTATPPTPPSVAVQQVRTVSTSSEQMSVSSPKSPKSRNIDYRGHWDRDVTHED